MSGVRKRTTRTSKKDVSVEQVDDDSKIFEAYAVKKQEPELNPATVYTSCDKIALGVITALAFCTRFYSISYPDQVVFDEVHFGKFAAYYLEKTYFFDLHPPFAKLLIALVGYLVGFDGSFKFDNIGDSYIENKIPYVALRSLSAVLGSLTVPIMYLTLRELNYSLPSAVFASLLVAFDNAHVGETRLILLDATLIISVAASIYCYIRFTKFRNQPFSFSWWKWMVLTGISLSCVISTKYVGVFTFITIGFAVALDLWDLLNINSGLTIRQFTRHFVARIYGLIILPFVIYLFWFYVHFEILTKSGPGDAFMSAEFQETLGDSPLAKEAKVLNYYDKFTFKHKQTSAVLHSHAYNYPLRYEDGRISSQGQQVTAFNTGYDINNEWQIIPARDFPENDREGKVVHIDDVVRFYHVNTDCYLLAHDVASPLYPTNEEFTCIKPDVAQERFNETLFKLQAADKASSGSPIKTKASVLKLLHVATTVALWTHDDVTLPEWAFNQLEVNGNKKISDSANIWTFDEITNLSESRKLYIPKAVRKMAFLRKWWELQRLMFDQNNKLSSEHPFASDPSSWPLSLSGVSFWNENTEKKQIYFIGNLFGWWLEVIVLGVFAGVFAGVKLAEQRNVYIFTKEQSKQLFNIGFLYIGYLSHYVFFFLMSRQKFLHHYLPAHLIAALLTAVIIEFFVGKGKPLVIIYSVLTIALITVFVFYAPITYGNVSLTPQQVIAREYFGIKLHFSK